MQDEEGNTLEYKASVNKSQVTSDNYGFNPGRIIASTTGTISTPNRFQRLGAITATVTFRMRLSGDRIEVDTCNVFGSATI